MTEVKPKSGLMAVKEFFGMTAAELKHEFDKLSDEEKRFFKEECTKALEESDSQ